VDLAAVLLAAAEDSVEDLAVAASLAAVLVATGNIHLFATKQVECLKVVKKQKTAIGKLKSLRWVNLFGF
jgi:hypothetical protein